MSDIQEEPAGGRNNPDPTERPSSSSMTPRRPLDGEDTQRFIEEVIELTSYTRVLRGCAQRLLALNEIYKGRKKAKAMLNTEKEIVEINLFTHRLKIRVDELDRSNAANRAVTNCGAGSSTDRLRISSTTNLKKELRETAAAFQLLITTAELEGRLQAVHDSEPLLLYTHEILLKIGTDVSPLDLRSASLRFVHDCIEMEVCRIVDSIAAKEDETLMSTVRNTITAMLTSLWR